jgi:hypothetical protein
MKTTRFFLAAILGLAMAFTLSCSGDDGTDGKNGLPGANGENGLPGVAGPGCDVEDAGVNYVMLCGGIEKARWPKAMCEREAYDPENMVCYDGIVGVVIDEQVWMIKDYTVGSTEGKYNWATANTACPTGWTLPSKADFEELISEVTTAAGLVEKGFPAAANSSWWSIVEEGGNDAYVLNINSSGVVSIRDILKSNLTSVRCIKE